MFRQCKSLYHRFRARHYVVESPGFPIKDNYRQLVGNIDKVEALAEKVTFHGWCHADQICLMTNGGGTTCVKPGIPRTDVSSKFGGSPHVGFCLTEAFGNGRYTLKLSRPEADIGPLHVRPISYARRTLAEIRVVCTFLKMIALVIPSILEWIVFKTHSARQQIKKSLDLEIATTHHALDSRVLHTNADTHVPRKPAGKITIILPVFNAIDLLPDVLDRIVRNTDLAWRLIIIEDCSTDQEIRPWLRKWVQAQRRAGIDQIDLIENSENRGFIRSVNSGLERAVNYGDHVVLLNSDARVPKHWASRLLAPIAANPMIASATPMSNDAEIFSAPFICKPMRLEPGQAEKIDTIASRLSVQHVDTIVPTGVGFCVAMNIGFLRRIPQLDTAFGRGYGEEVDWCQKTRQMNGQHVVVPNLFVEHCGGASFGDSTKQALIAQNNDKIAKRYPGYNLEVQHFIQSDPLITPRIMLAVAWAAQRSVDRRLPIYLAHSMGGGADLYLEDRMQADWKAEGLPSIVLRVGGTSRWQIEVVAGQHRTIGTLDDIHDVRRLLAPAKRRQIVYSCGVGDHTPERLPQELISLKQSASDALEVLVHDYFMISPDYTLLNEAGIYFGLGDLHSHASQKRRELQSWQSEWASLIKTADRICVFSESSRNILLQHYPFARRKTKLQPHKLLEDIPDLSAPPVASQERVIAVLGNIGRHKGAAVVGELATLLEWHQGVRLMVLGALDPAYQIPKSVHIHGAYDLNNLPNLVSKYQITDWFIPSIWPETFSYTTHEALATGLPTFAFDIGAQGEAVACNDNGCTIPYDDGATLAENAFAVITQSVETSRKGQLDLAVGTS